MSTTEVTSQRFKLYSVPELIDLPQLGWLIEGLFPVGALIGVYGPSGHAKSFLALDWALSTAQGGAWLERPIRQGAVVYVAAEGGRSIRKRVAAWMRQRELSSIPWAFFLLEGVQITEKDDLELLASRIKELGIEPVLIVLDTLARCFVGKDENSAQEMGEFVHGLDWLNEQTGAAIMMLHHTGKQAQDMERGSSALRAAADVMIRVSKNENVVTVHNNKQKDDEGFKDIHLRLKQVALENGDTSCVLEPGTARPNASAGLSSAFNKTLSALASSPRETLTTLEWAARANLKERTLHSHRKELLQRRFIEEVKRGVYRVSEKGREALQTAAPARHMHLVEL